MIGIERVLVDVESLIIVIDFGINDSWIVAESLLALDPFDRGSRRFERPVDANHLHVILATLQCMEMLYYEYAVHVLDRQQTS